MRAFLLAKAGLRDSFNSSERQRRRTAETPRLVARPARRKRTGSTRKRTDNRSRKVAIPTSCNQPDRMKSSPSLLKIMCFGNVSLNTKFEIQMFGSSQTSDNVLWLRSIKQDDGEMSLNILNFAYMRSHSRQLPNPSLPWNSSTMVNPQ